MLQLSNEVMQILNPDIKMLCLNGSAVFDGFYSFRSTLYEKLL